MSISNKMAQYVKTLLDIQKKVVIERLEDPPKGVPRYSINGKPFFSVTQILDTGKFDDLDPVKMTFAKAFGSIVHGYIENYFKDQDLMHNQRPDDLELIENIPFASEQDWQDYKNGLIDEPEELFIRNKIKDAFDQFFNFLEDYDVELIFSEEPIWSPNYLYAGTVDLFCYLNGVPAIIDHKTSKFVNKRNNGFDSYIAQLSAYQQAIKELVSEDFVAECYILHLNPYKSNYELIRRPYNFSMFLDALANFSGGNPSKNFYYSVNSNKDNKNDKTNNQVLDRTNKAFTNKEIIRVYSCPEKTCSEKSVFIIKEQDLTLVEKNIPVVSKCTFHEGFNHYHILHLKTDDWRPVKEFLTPV